MDTFLAVLISAALAAYAAAKAWVPLSVAVNALWRRFCSMALVTALAALAFFGQMTYHAATKGEQAQTDRSTLLQQDTGAAAHTPTVVPVLRTGSPAMPPSHAAHPLHSTGTTTRDAATPAWAAMPEGAEVYGGWTNYGVSAAVFYMPTVTPLHIYIIRDAGGDYATTEDIVDAWITELNLIYRQAVMSFYRASVTYIDDRPEWFHIPRQNVLETMCSYTNNTGGLEVYCVGSLYDDNAGIHSTSENPATGLIEKGLAVAASAPFGTLAHEVGNACGLWFRRNRRPKSETKKKRFSRFSRLTSAGGLW